MKIAFCGQMGTGKDTMGEKFKETFKEALHYSFATPLREESQNFISDSKKLKKEELLKKYKITLEDFSLIENLLDKIDNIYKRTPETRKFLQLWGTNIRRKKEKNYWIDKVKLFIEKNNDKDFYITDARFFNELELLKKLNFKLILLETSKEERIKRIFKRDNIIPTEETLNHPSERDSLLYNDYDLVIKTDTQTEEETFKEIKKRLYF